MSASELLKKVRRIEIKTKGLSNHIFAGEYHTAFKGKGMAFSEVREYETGDDIRSIDWNVTARYNSPFVKVFEEEREMTVMLLVDISASGNFGTSKMFKRELATEIAAIIAFSAIKNNDKVGLILFSDDVVKYVPPKKGKTHVLRIVRELLYVKSIGKSTSIKKGLEFLNKVAKRKAVIFLLSDFIDDNYWDAIKIVNKKHDLIAINIFDPFEINFPNSGMIKIEDPETKSRFWIDACSTDILNKMNNENIDKIKYLEKLSKKIGLDLISISTAEDYVEPLLNLFKKRGKKY